MLRVVVETLDSGEHEEMIDAPYSLAAIRQKAIDVFSDGFVALETSEGKAIIIPVRRIQNIEIFDV